MRIDGPLLIVLNRGSGHGDAEKDRQISAGILEAAGRPFELLMADTPGDLPALAARAAARAAAVGGVVVAAGGDGTINTVAQAVVDHAATLPFGVLPQGTFNYFGRVNGIPTDTATATHVLLTGQPRPNQVGLANDSVFLVNASFGLYPRILEDREATKQVYGRRRLVAFASGVRTMMREDRDWLLHLQHDGDTEILRATTLFIGNNVLQMRQLGLPEAEELGHGALAAIAIRPIGRAARLALLMRGLIGRLAQADYVHNFAFQDLRVEPRLERWRSEVKVSVDGEVQRLRPPLRFRVADRPLWVLAPPPDEAGNAAP